MAVYEYQAHIRYSDIDENNELSDKGLINILSEVAGKHSAVVGNGLNDIEKTGTTWMLLFWKVRFFKRPSWNTDLDVKTWARSFNKISSWRDFEVYDEKGEKVAIATTEWVLIDAKKQGIGRITDEIMNLYGMVEKSVFEEEPTGKLKEEENMKETYRYTAVRRDIDVNHHVNNANYLDIAYEAFPIDVEINKFENIEIYYKKQIKLGETVCCYYSNSGDTHTVSIRSQDGKNIHAILKFFN